MTDRRLSFRNCIVGGKGPGKNYLEGRNNRIVSRRRSKENTPGVSGIVFRFD